MEPVHKKVTIRRKGTKTAVKKLTNSRIFLEKIYFKVMKSIIKHPA